MPDRPTNPLPTPEQIAAIRQRGSLCVLSSGAGCGKTFVLTSRYVSLIQDDQLNVEQIATLTFTNEAARVMMERIRQRLPGTRFEAAPIQTIHSFGQSLIREYHERLGFPADVRLDERPEQSQATAIRERLETHLVTDTPLSEDVKDVVVTYGWQRTLGLMGELLKEPDRPAWQAFTQKSADSIVGDWLKLRDRIRPMLIDHWAQADPPIAVAIRLLHDLPAPSRTIQNGMRSIIAAYQLLKTSTNIAEDLKNLNELAKVKTVGGPGGWSHSKGYEQIKHALEDFRSALKKRANVFADPDPGLLTKAAEVALRVMRVAVDLHEHFQAWKKAEGLIDYTDQLVLARDLLRDHDDLKMAIPERFKAVMVDEFQDTDPVQLELIRLVCGGAEAPSHLFVVGDPKQSIYRFRGADSTLFEQLRTITPAAGQLRLSLNRRSRPGIIHFVNTLFEKRMKNYEPITAVRTEKGPTPDVEFLWTLPPDPKKKESAENLRSLEARAIARRILELTEDGSCKRSDIVILFRRITIVAAYEKALRDAGIDYYLQGGFAFFAQQEIYDLRMLITAVENPLDEIALAGLLRSPFGGLSDNALTLLAQPGEFLFDQVMTDDRLARLTPDDRDALLRFRECYTRWRAMKDDVSVTVLLQTAIADTGYDAALQFEPLGDRKLANLWKLIDLARNYDERRVGLAGFVEELQVAVEDELRESQAATNPENADVVRLMTIHQAKGLEFPVVFVPDLAAEQRGGFAKTVRWHRLAGCVPRMPGDMHPEDQDAFSTLPVELAQACDDIGEWQEELRILYVACTRAEDRLILSTSWPKELEPGSPTVIPKGGENSNTLLLSEQFDLMNGRCLVPTSQAQAGVRIVTKAELDAFKSRIDTKHNQTPPPWRPKLPGEIAAEPTL